MNICHVCDSNKHTKDLMRWNYEPSDIFMTIRIFNILKARRPKCSFQKYGKTYFIFENQKYTVKRVRNL